MTQRLPATRGGRDDRGVVAVEFALVAPLLLALVFTVFTAMSVYLDQIHLEAAARNGARVGSVGVKDACSAVQTELKAENAGTVTCTVVKNCTTGTVQVDLTSRRNVSIPLVGNRTVSLRASSSYSCPGP